MSRQLHIHISGDDYPGILSDILRQAVQFNWNIVDVKQFVFNGLLNLSLLMEGVGEVDALKAGLEEFGHRTGLRIKLHPWDAGSHLTGPYQHRFVLTVLAKEIDSNALLELTQTVAALDINILRIDQLDYSDYHVLEFVLGRREPVPKSTVFEELVRFKENRNVDIAVQEDTMFRRNKRLIVLDADMTFLQCEVIDELGKLAGVEGEMTQITKRAMNGKVDFEAALRERVRLLKGLPVSRLYELLPRIPMTPGAEVLVRILKHLGFKIAIVSGGFRFFIDKLKDKYQLDYSFANELEFKDDYLTGDLEGDIINPKSKEKILVSLAERDGLSLKQVVAVGDGANDIHMLGTAGLGIAFNAKPIVQQHVQASININDLELILYFLGISGKELQELRRIVDEEVSALIE